MQTKKPVIKISNLSKKFCPSLKRSLWYGVKDLFSELSFSCRSNLKLRKGEFWALKDINFELYPGETLGLIGFNGAGKSTLLKIINGILKPDEGTVSVSGKVGALIQLGIGFNPILSGRENVYVSASILGLKKKEIDKIYDEILEFADIGDFINSPVRNYSSGMKVRLGFAIASMINPEILLIDEILAVGDSSFRKRCLDRLVRYKEAGGTIIFVSHNSIAVEAICDKVLLLSKGTMEILGETSKVVKIYEAQALKLTQTMDQRLLARHNLFPGNKIVIRSVEFFDMNGNKKDHFEFGESFEVKCLFEQNRIKDFPFFVLSIKSEKISNANISTVAMSWDVFENRAFPETGVVSCKIENLMLSPGVYKIDIGVIANPSLSLGEKWHLPPEEFSSFIIVPGILKSRLPGIPSTHLISKMPPVVLDHKWYLDGKIIESIN